MVRPRSCATYMLLIIYFLCSPTKFEYMMQIKKTGDGKCTRKCLPDTRCVRQHNLCAQISSFNIQIRVDTRRFLNKLFCWPSFMRAATEKKINKKNSQI